MVFSWTMGITHHAHGVQNVQAIVNLALSTDLRVIAEDARLIAGFIRIGIHPGGGHFNLVGRLAGREAAAALGVFGEEITGIRAAELGMAWRALPSEDVEPYARSLAARNRSLP